MEKKLDVYRKSLTAIAQECSENDSCTATNHPSRKLSKLDESDTWDTVGEVRTNS